MNFWDSSALVALCVEETHTPSADGWYRDDSEIVAWTLSSVEVLSTMYRRRRDGSLDEAAFVAAREKTRLLFETIAFVKATESVKRRAERLLEFHPLRAADALQLASALVSAKDDPSAHTFLTFDSHLKVAAGKEGFRMTTS